MEQNLKNNYEKLFTVLLNKVTAGKNYKDLSQDSQSKADELISIIDKIKNPNLSAGVDSEVASLLDKNRDYYKNLLGNDFDTLKALFPPKTKTPATQTTTTPQQGNDLLTGLGGQAGGALKEGADMITGFSEEFQDAIGLDKNKVGKLGHIATGVAGFMALGAVTGLAGSAKKLAGGDVFGAVGGVFGVVKSAFILGVGVLIANCFWGKDGHHLSQNQSKNTEPAHTV